MALRSKAQYKILRKHIAQQLLINASVDLLHDQIGDQTFKKVFLTNGFCVDQNELYEDYNPYLLEIKPIK